MPTPPSSQEIDPSAERVAEPWHQVDAREVRADGRVHELVGEARTGVDIEPAPDARAHLDGEIQGRRVRPARHDRLVPPDAERQLRVSVEQTEMPVSADERHPVEEGGLAFHVQRIAQSIAQAEGAAGTVGTPVSAEHLGGRSDHPQVARPNRVDGPGQEVLRSCRDAESHEGERRRGDAELLLHRHLRIVPEDLVGKHRARPGRARATGRSACGYAAYSLRRGPRSGPSWSFPL